MKRGYLLPLAALALLALPALAPFAQPGYFWGAHDARHNVYFLFEFDRAWQDGIFFPRWAPDFTFGYGYPFWIVYAPLATYLGQAFHLLGFGSVSYTHLRAHETVLDLVCRLLLEKKNTLTTTDISCI